MNEKIIKVANCVVTIAGLVQIIAKAVIAAFPVSKKTETLTVDLNDVDKENAQVIAQFLAQERVKNG